MNSVKALMELSHVRLDREHLGGIDNLDCLGPVTNLYLQHVSGVINLLYCTCIDTSGATVFHFSHKRGYHFLKICETFCTISNISEVDLKIF